jgi:maltooligosyltrehalose trehalohydrolase
VSATVFASADGDVADYPWERPLGARPRGDGSVEFRAWAPRAGSVSLRLGSREIELDDAGHGVYEAIEDGHPGDDYWFVLDGRQLPDPCSRWQPEGIRGPSRIVEVPEPAAFTPPVTRDLVIYE